jgi:hypothetical protein
MRGAGRSLFLGQAVAAGSPPPQSPLCSPTLLAAAAERNRCRCASLPRAGPALPQAGVGGASLRAHPPALHRCDAGQRGCRAPGCLPSSPFRHLALRPLALCSRQRCTEEDLEPLSELKARWGGRLRALVHREACRELAASVVGGCKAAPPFMLPAQSRHSSVCELTSLPFGNLRCRIEAWVHEQRSKRMATG